MIKRSSIILTIILAISLTVFFIWTAHNTRERSKDILTEFKEIDKSLSNDTSPADKNSAIPQHKTLMTHLHDTTFITGKFILFLRPDSLRFESYSEDSNIYDADSDFGFWITTALDSLSKDEFKNLQTGISTNRYISIKECKNCPRIIDRDTINYGTIWTGRNKEIRMENIFPGEYYPEAAREYFGIKH